LVRVRSSAGQALQSSKELRLGLKQSSNWTVQIISFVCSTSDVYTTRLSSKMSSENLSGPLILTGRIRLPLVLSGQSRNNRLRCPNWLGVLCFREPSCMYSLNPKMNEAMQGPFSFAVTKICGDKILSVYSFLKSNRRVYCFSQASLLFPTENRVLVGI
jgi:hypothetical protein